MSLEKVIMELDPGWESRAGQMEEIQVPGSPLSSLKPGPSFQEDPQ